VPDTTSGFRAYSRDAALRLTVVSDFTYTIETLIQASQKSLHTSSVPIRVNPVLRESRLFASTWSYIHRSVRTMVRLYVIYQPLRIFLAMSALFLGAALLLFGRFLYFYFTLGGSVQTGHVQSLIVAGALSIIGVLMLALGILADLTAMNRRLMEEILINSRVLRYGRDRTSRPEP
jgi:hypothetical protein